MKQCFKCRVAKPLTDFYRHPQMGDGHLNKCKECTKRDTELDRQRKISTPEGAAAERARHRDKYHRLEYAEKYRGRSAKYQDGYNERFPEKKRARSIVMRELRARRMVRPEICQECGGPPPIQGHHPDYTKPLDVMWLCVPCHGIQHRKEAA